jgi:hypothetical protein
MRAREFVTPLHSRSIEEVAMNPAAYTDSMSAAAEQGVLVGFEFEVYVPAQTITSQQKQTNLGRSGINLFWHVAKNAPYELDLDVAGFNQLFRKRRPLEISGRSIDSMADYVKEKLSWHVGNIKKYFDQLSEPTRRRILDYWNNSPENQEATQEDFLDWMRENLADIQSDMSWRDADYQIISDMFTMNLDLYLTSEQRIISKLMYDTANGRGSVTQANFRRSFEWDDAALAKRYRDLAAKIDDDDGDGFGDDNELYRRAVPVLEPAVAKTMGAKVRVFRSYHQQRKNLRDWYLEPDGSLTEPDSPDDGAAEIVGPPMPVQKAMQTLQKFYGMARELSLYTKPANDDGEGGTGLHINVSIPGNLDILKLAVVLGDDYVLRAFGREKSDYAKSVIQDLERSADPETMLRQRRGRTEFDLKALKQLAKDFTRSHTASISDNGEYISFRQVGGDYLNNSEAVVDVLGRFVRAMVIAANPQAYRAEYLKKLSALTMQKTQPETPITPREILDLRKQGVPALNIYAWQHHYFPSLQDVWENILNLTRDFGLTEKDITLIPLPMSKNTMMKKFPDVELTETIKYGSFRMTPKTLRAAVTMQKPAVLQTLTTKWKPGYYLGVPVIEPARVPINDPSVSGVVQDISARLKAVNKGSPV